MIYGRSTDHPDGFVARIWADGKATEFYTLADSLEEIRKAIPDGLLQFGWRPEDDPCVVEA